METKFNIGDRVFLELKVDSIDITSTGIEYTLNKNTFESIKAKEEQIVDSKFVSEWKSPSTYEYYRG